MTAGAPTVATALSRRTLAFGAESAAGRAASAIAGLARRSLRIVQTRMASPASQLYVAASLAGAPGCLVTETPTFSEPAQTRPFLLAETAEPDLREMLVVTPEQGVVTFRASFVSEDAGEQVQARLLLDYGVRNEFTEDPYQDAEITGGLDENPGRLSDGPRVMTMRLQVTQVPAGCHTVTMIVSHSFDGIIAGCPRNLDDSSQLTWQMFRCSDPAVSCPPTGESFDPTLDCPVATESCPQFDLGDGGAP